MTIPTNLAVVRLCARLELSLAVRSRWTQIFAVVFGALSLAVALSGYVMTGGYGVQDFARTAVSLVQLVVLLVPLTALLIGVLALSPDRGAAELLFSQPASRSAILFGQVLGLWEALVAAQALGFGAAGLVIYNQAGEEGLGAFVALFGASALLTAIFLGFAAVVSAGSMGRRRSRALALALVTWFVAVVLFDLAVLGAATWLPSGYASRLLISSVLVNPVDATRTGTLLLVEGAAAFGAASLALLRFTRGTTGAAILITASLALWLFVPLAWAAWKLKRVDL